jgi:hypothetical protein
VLTYVVGRAGQRVSGGQGRDGAILNEAETDLADHGGGGAVGVGAGLAGGAPGRSPTRSERACECWMGEDPIRITLMNTGMRNIAPPAIGTRIARDTVSVSRCFPRWVCISRRPGKCLGVDSQSRLRSIDSTRFMHPTIPCCGRSAETVKIVTLAVLVRKFRCSTTHFGEPIALRPCYSISYRRADEVDRLVPDIHGGLVPVDERGVGCELESAIGSTGQV